MWQLPCRRADGRQCQDSGWTGRKPAKSCNAPAAGGSLARLQTSRMLFHRGNVREQRFFRASPSTIGLSPSAAAWLDTIYSLWMSANHSHKTSLGALTVGALGVVFGDIGTSPLYTLKE